MSFAEERLANLGTQMNVFHKGVAIEAAQEGDVSLLQVLLWDDIAENIYSKQLDEWQQCIFPLKDQDILLEEQKKVLQNYQHLATGSLLPFTEINTQLELTLGAAKLMLLDSFKECHQDITSEVDQFLMRTPFTEVRKNRLYQEYLSSIDLQIDQNKIHLESSDPRIIKAHLDQIELQQIELKKQHDEIVDKKTKWLNDALAAESIRYKRYENILYHYLYPIDPSLFEQDKRFQNRATREYNKRNLPDLYRQVFLAKNLEDLQVAGWQISEEDEPDIVKTEQQVQDKFIVEQQKAKRYLIKTCKPAVPVNTINDQGYSLLALALQESAGHNPLASALLISYGADAFQSYIGVDGQERKPIDDIADSKNFGLFDMLKYWLQFKVTLGKENWSILAVRESYDKLQKGYTEYEKPIAVNEEENNCNNPNGRKNLKFNVEVREFFNYFLRQIVENWENPGLFTSKDQALETLNNHKDFYLKGKEALKKAEWQGHDTEVIDFLKQKLQDSAFTKKYGGLCDSIEHMILQFVKNPQYGRHFDTKRVSSVMSNLMKSQDELLKQKEGALGILSRQWQEEIASRDERDKIKKNKDDQRMEEIKKEAQERAQLDRIEIEQKGEANLQALRMEIEQNKKEEQARRMKMEQNFEQKVRAQEIAMQQQFAAMWQLFKQGGGQSVASSSSSASDVLPALLFAAPVILEQNMGLSSLAAGTEVAPQ